MTRDYRDLLRRYIEHVGACEGVDFLSDIYPAPDGRFSEAEIKELRLLSEESRQRQGEG